MMFSEHSEHCISDSSEQGLDIFEYDEGQIQSKYLQSVVSNSDDVLVISQTEGAKI